MASASDLTRMVPGFDFMQKLMQGAGNSIPGVSQWIAPTLDPEELDKRIQELKTVQFWLEQNAKLLAATIQGLEVQRMTLSTLQSMNLPLAELRDALTIKPMRAAPAPAPEPPPAPAPTPAPEPEPAAEAPTAAAAPPAVDPMQWWGALTQQFTELASQAVKGAQAVAPAAASRAAAPAPAAAKTPARARRAAGSGIAAAAPRKRSR
jgi:hypothetical protein